MPLAWFISFRTYGSWLRGDERGSVDLDHNTPGTPLLTDVPARTRYEQGLLKHEVICLDDERRFVVDAAIRAVCAFRQWPLHALQVREQHIHSVVTAPCIPERVMNDFKIWATRRLNDSGVLAVGINRGPATAAPAGSIPMSPSPAPSTTLSTSKAHPCP